MKNILSLLFLVSLLDASFIRDNPKMIVLDTTTKLIWQDSNIMYKTWGEAIEYCANLSHASFDDWRLPNVSELASIADLSKYSPTIDPSFKQITDARYWSSTTKVADTSTAWSVNFRNGSIDSPAEKSSDFYVRCVRSINN